MDAVLYGHQKPLWKVEYVLRDLIFPRMPISISIEEMKWFAVQSAWTKLEDWILWIFSRFCRSLPAAANGISYSRSQRWYQSFSHLQFDTIASGQQTHWPLRVSQGYCTHGQEAKAHPTGFYPWISSANYSSCDMTTNLSFASFINVPPCKERLCMPKNVALMRENELSKDLFTYFVNL